VSTTYSYDNNNRLNSTTQCPKITNFTYDNNGFLKTRSAESETITSDWINDRKNPRQIEARQVLDTFVRETDALVDLYVDGEVISTSGEHPFWAPDFEWVEAKDLIVGSLLQTEDGRIVDIDRAEKRFGKFPVYNFKVEGIPTYFVSDLGVLVHNTCDPSAPNAGLENLPIHRKRIRFYAKASELTVEDNAAREYITSTLLSKGTWSDVGKARLRAAVNLVYPLERGELKLSVAEALLQLQDAEKTPGLSSTVRFNFPVNILALV
jgi:hypothetical protein